MLKKPRILLPTRGSGEFENHALPKAYFWFDQVTEIISFNLLVSTKNMLIVYALPN
jgi:hypothetical protein